MGSSWYNYKTDEKGRHITYIQLLRDERKHSEDDVEIYKMNNQSPILERCVLKHEKNGHYR